MHLDFGALLMSLFSLKAKHFCSFMSSLFPLFFPLQNLSSSLSSSFILHILSMLYSSSSSSSWFLSYTKLLFFTQIRRFLQHKTSMTSTSSIPIENPILDTKLAKKDAYENDTNLLQRSVKLLHFGNQEEKTIATEEITKLANKDLKTRKSLASLGVIPSLLSMLDSGSKEHRRLAVIALIALVNGTYTNKALMVEAGIYAKLSKNRDILDHSGEHCYVLLLQYISSISDTQFTVTCSSEILQFLIGILDSSVATVEVKVDCLDVLFNLSSVLDNADHLVSNGVAHTLLKCSSEKEISEKALATLGNLVVSMLGKKEMEDDPAVPANLIEIMTWESKPKCQELAAYILMILAHQSSKQREKMAKLGIVQVLLELALLGSPLAQKRALKLLQWFKDERQTRIGAHSGPQAGRVAVISPNVNKGEINEGRKIIKMMVKQSLDKNMEMIMRRANAGDSSKLKNLVISSSSKSLPY